MQWLKSEGDAIKKGEAIVVVESDKADMDVESFYNGILAGVAVGDGETAKVCCFDVLNCQKSGKCIIQGRGGGESLFLKSLKRNRAKYVRALIKRSSLFLIHS